MSVRIECQRCAYRDNPRDAPPLDDVADFRCLSCGGQVLSTQSPWSVLTASNRDPTEVRLWKEVVSCPAEVAVWASRGFGPEEAARWVRPGWTAAQATALVKRVTRPSGIVGPYLPGADISELDGRPWPEIDAWLKSGVSAGRILLGLDAGLAREEIVSLDRSGAWDEDALRTLAALRKS